MSFLRRLPGTAPDESRAYRGRGDGFASDPQGVYWQVTSSPDGRWAILTRDVDDADRQIGYRTSGPGRYRLVEGSDTRCEGRLQRPNDAKVANNGTFVVADWLFTDDLTSRVCIFDASATPVVDITVGAMVACTGLSEDGHFAAVHLASNPARPEFDELVVVWDASTGTTMWSKALESGRADSFVIDPGSGVLRANTRSLGTIDYDLVTGETDLDVIRTSLLEHGDGFEVLSLCQEEFASGPLEGSRARVLMAACESAAEKLRGYPSHEARALRLAGESAEAQRAPADALIYWERALAIDAKVGIAKGLSGN